MGPSSGGGGLPFQGVDCSDGLARCVEGRLEASRLYRYEVPCRGPAESCSCPWERLSACPAGCLAEGVAVVLPRERAAQLCAPETPDTASFARPPPEHPELQPGWCSGELFRCLGGLIIACSETGPSAVATCLRGCAEEDAFLDDPVPREAAIAILCAR